MSPRSTLRSACPASSPSVTTAARRPSLQTPTPATSGIQITVCSTRASPAEIIRRRVREPARRRPARVRLEARFGGRALGPARSFFQGRRRQAAAVLLRTRLDFRPVGRRPSSDLCHRLGRAGLATSRPIRAGRGGWSWSTTACRATARSSMRERLSGSRQPQRRRHAALRDHDDPVPLARGGAVAVADVTRGARPESGSRPRSVAS